MNTFKCDHCDKWHDTEEIHKVETQYQRRFRKAWASSLPFHTVKKTELWCDNCYKEEK